MSDVEVRDSGRASTPAWDPLAEMESWARRFGTWPSPDRWSGLMSALEEAAFTPLADIEETDAAWTIEVELAGLKKKDIKLETRGRTVVISGERKEKERVGVLRQRRRVTGAFRLEVTLSNDIDADSVEASLTDGVLTVTVPKAEQDQSRQISIS